MCRGDKHYRLLFGVDVQSRKCSRPQGHTWGPLLSEHLLKDAPGARIRGVKVRSSEFVCRSSGVSPGYRLKKKSPPQDWNGMCRAWLGPLAISSLSLLSQCCPHREHVVSLKLRDPWASLGGQQKVENVVEGQSERRLH